ncbi:hypothetical protein D3C86_1592230 [compost metagenome]
MVGRQTGDELPGIAPQLLALAIDAEQIVQVQVETHLQRPQRAVPPFALPASGQAGVPVDPLRRLRQQRLHALEHLLGARQKLTQTIIHAPLPVTN